MCLTYTSPVTNKYTKLLTGVIKRVDARLQTSIVDLEMVHSRGLIPTALLFQKSICFSRLLRLDTKYRCETVAVPPVFISSILHQTDGWVICSFEVMRETNH
jgi:hypothetical protein